jgi:hypothetical protein
MLWMKIQYRSRYYWRKVCHFFGFCYNCGSRINYHKDGLAFCPGCGKR